MTTTQLDENVGQKGDGTHASADGMVRLRITKVYRLNNGSPNVGGTPHDKVCVTYDDQVLTSEAILDSQHAWWIRPDVSCLVDFPTNPPKHETPGRIY
jgi:hypothetical protein